MKPALRDKYMMRLQIGDNVTADIHHDNTVILSWPDGTFVSGSRLGGNRNAGPTARKLGYRSMQEMFCEHELTHVALAHWLQTPSPVMLALRGYESDAHLCNLEEQMVLALQAYMRAMKINLRDRLSAPQLDYRQKLATTTAPMMPTSRIAPRTDRKKSTGVEV